MRKKGFLKLLKSIFFLMDTANFPSSSSPSNSLPWLWVIETLADFKEVDTALLNDLISRVSELYGESWGKNARERLALRQLEDLLSGPNGNADTSNVPLNFKPHCEVGIDMSEPAQEVLARFLSKMAASNLRMSISKLLKQDVRQFIVQKRAALPKCALQQLKDTILEGGHPYATFLRDRSGLDKDQEEDRIVDGGDLNAAMERLDQSTNDFEIQAPKENFIHLAPDNGNKLLQEDPCGKDLKSIGREMAKQNQVKGLDKNRICLDIVDDLANSLKQGVNNGEFHSIYQNSDTLALENRNEIIQEDPSDGILISRKRERSGFTNEQQLGCLDVGKVTVDSSNHHRDAKKLTKFDELKSMGQNSTPLLGHELLQDPPGRILLSAEREVCGLAKEIQVQDLQKKGICVDDGNDYDHVASKRHKQSTNDGLIQHNQSHIPFNEEKITIEAPLDEPYQNNYVGEAKDESEHRNKPETSSGNDGNLNKDPSFDLDDEMAIAAEKRSFLSSQNTSNEDSLTADWTEQSFCIKCDKGGPLLICSVRACPLAVHETCVDSSASIDDTGNFYCPFCSYTRATAAYCEAKKKVALVKEKAALARNHLSKFMCMVQAHQQKQPSEITPTEEPSQSRMDGDANILKEIHGSRQQTERINNQSVHAVVHQQEAEVAVEFLSSVAPCRGAPLPPISERNDVALTREEEHPKQVNHQNRIVLEDQQHPEPSSVHGCDDLLWSEEEKTEICEKIPDVSLRKERGKAKMDEEHQSISGWERNQVAACRKRNTANSPRRDIETDSISREHADVGTENADVQQTVDTPHKPSSQLDINAEEIAENENDDTDSRKRRRPANRHSNRALPSRRKKIPWTAEEEEILKEGVCRLGSTDGKNVPWKKILEFGCHVFQRSRTTVDLKDKWRNIWTRGPRAR